MKLALQALCWSEEKQLQFELDVLNPIYSHTLLFFKKEKENPEQVEETNL